MNRGLVQTLPDGPIDVVGDVHGELDALKALMKELGYSADGVHPEQRRLVFVGDLCDRGPDSVGVIALVEQMVKAGNAFAVLGNHEMNLLRSDAKDGSGWYFESRVKADESYQPFVVATEAQKVSIASFLSTLPLALERDDLRVVHAAWMPEHIEVARGNIDSQAHHVYDKHQNQVNIELRADGRHQRYLDEKFEWKDLLEVEGAKVPVLHAIAEYDVACQVGNPIKVLVSGVERKGLKPFFSSHKWRFVDRIQWWDEYDEATPVIIGHYWRMTEPQDRESVGKGDPYLFHDVDPNAWHGLRKNVFCVDFSVGGRWRERKAQEKLGSRFKLGAMRWPEKEIVFDTGERQMTA
jgi:hypothetical protein